MNMSSSKSKKRPHPGSPMITNFFTKESCVTGDSSLVSDLCESVSNDAVQCDSPAAKRAKKERASGFDPQWKTDFIWVREVDGGMMCTLCVRHQRRPKRSAIGKAAWVDVPCTWLVREALSRHQRCETHQEAMLFEANRLAPKSIEGAVEEMSSLQLKARIAAFRNIYWLMKREIPHTTNYLSLNELSKLQGVDILNNLYQGDNDKGESQRFLQEAVLTMGRVLREDILQEARESPWYSVLIDETTDIAVVSEMIVYIRYLKEGESRTEFVSIIPLPDGKADTITKALVDFLVDEAGLPLEKLCAFGSDGAAVMVGRQNGVATQLRRRVPHLLSNHCVAHRLALSAAQAVKGISYLVKFKDILGDLHRFYSKSPVRTNGLKAIQELLKEPVLKLVEAKDVRWLSHDKATSTLRKSLPSIYTSLEREAEERNDVKAAGLSRFTQDYRFVMSLHMMCDILPHLTELSLAMQMRDAVYTTVKPLVRGTVAVLRGLLAEPGEAYQTAVTRVQALHDEGFRIRVPSTQEVEQFHSKIYVPYVSNVVQNLQDRFPDLPVLQKFEVFNTVKFPEGCMDGHGDEDIKELAEHFMLPVDKTVLDWQQVRGSLTGTELTADKAMGWVAKNLTTSHERLYKLAAAGLLLPTSTADCERGFSALGRIKTTHRATVSNKVLNSLLTVSLQGPAVEDVDFDRMVRHWHKERPRRTQI